MHKIERKYIQKDNGTRSFLETGNGRPLLMLHGLMSNAWDFSFQFDEFSSEYRCIAPDMCGCGMSNVPNPSEVNLEQAVDDALGFISLAGQGGADPVTLLGHSFGSVVAAEILARVPERLARVILVAPPAAMPSNPLLKPALPLYRKAARLFHRDVIDFYSLNINVSSANMTPEIKRSLRRRNRYISHTDAIAMGAFFQSMLTWTIPDLSKAVHVPVLLVFGSKDLLVGGNSEKLLKRAISWAENQSVNNARHSPMYEKPLEFNSILRKFIDAE